MAYNPFRPNSLVPTGIFTGRYDETVAIEDMLFNTLHGNPQHFLLHGERGIGKSSLLYIHELVAKGRIAPIGKKKNFNFIVVSLSLDSGDTYDTLIEKIAFELRTSCAKEDQSRALLQKTWEFVSRIEAAGVRLRPQTATDAILPLNNLVQTFVQTCEDIKGHYDGVLLLIDEADKAPASAQLGSTLKTLTERVSRSENNVLAVGLAGVSSLISILRESHESSPRLFTTLDLKPLSDDEAKEVIQRSLKEAEEKNGFRTDIAPGAEARIVQLSEGYPSFIQEFGYCAFASDSDDSISLEDVEAGAWSEHGAFTQLGAKYFKHLYFGKIASDKYRQLLQIMATHDDEWLTKAELRQEAGLSETILTNALQALLSRKIIVAREGKKGVYRLPSKSFAAWLRAYKLRGESPTDISDPWIFVDNSDLIPDDTE
jgi:Cdc6-like AAA superfamily ATPase